MLSARAGADGLVYRPSEIFQTFKARPDLLELNPTQAKFILRGSRGAGKTNLLLLQYYLSLALYLVCAHRQEKMVPFPFYANMAFEPIPGVGFYEQWMAHLFNEIKRNLLRLQRMFLDGNWPETIINEPLRWISRERPGWFEDFTGIVLDGKNPGGTSEEFVASLNGGGIHKEIVRIERIITGLADCKITTLRELNDAFVGVPLRGFIDEVSGVIANAVDLSAQYDQIFSDSYRYQEVVLVYAIVKDHFTDKPNPPSYVRKDLDFDISTRVGYLKAREFIYSLFDNICQESDEETDISSVLDISEDRDDALREVILFSSGHPRSAIEAFRNSLSYVISETGGVAGATILPEHVQYIIKQIGENIQGELLGAAKQLNPILAHITAQCKANHSRYLRIHNIDVGRFERLFWNLHNEPVVHRCSGSNVCALQYSVCLLKNLDVKEDHNRFGTKDEVASIFDYTPASRI
jgi:hypothetical protein